MCKTKIRNDIYMYVDIQIQSTKDEDLIYITLGTFEDIVRLNS